MILKDWFFYFRKCSKWQLVRGVLIVAFMMMACPQEGVAETNTISEVNAPEAQSRVQRMVSTFGEIKDNAGQSFANIKDSVTNQMTEMGNKVNQRLDKMAGSIDEKFSEINARIEGAVNDSKKETVDALKAWFRSRIEPFLPLIYVISFLFLFGLLKLVFPFSETISVQMLAVVISFSCIFIVFVRLGLVRYGLIGSLWILVPVALILGIRWFFSRKRQNMYYDAENNLTLVYGGAESIVAVYKGDKRKKFCKEIDRNVRQDSEGDQTGSGTIG